MIPLVNKEHLRLLILMILLSKVVQGQTCPITMTPFYEGTSQVRWTEVTGMCDVSPYTISNFAFSSFYPVQTIVAENFSQFFNLVYGCNVMSLTTSYTARYFRVVSNTLSNSIIMSQLTPTLLRIEVYVGAYYEGVSQGLQPLYATFPAYIFQGASVSTTTIETLMNYLCNQLILQSVDTITTTATLPGKTVTVFATTTRSLFTSTTTTSVTFTTIVSTASETQVLFTIVDTIINFTSSTITISISQTETIMETRTRETTFTLTTDDQTTTISPVIPTITVSTTVISTFTSGIISLTLTTTDVYCSDRDPLPPNLNNCCCSNLK